MHKSHLHYKHEINPEEIQYTHIRNQNCIVFSVHTFILKHVLIVKSTSGPHSIGDPTVDVCNEGS